MNHKYIAFVYLLVALFFFASLLSFVFYPDAFVILYVLGVNIVPIYAAHFSSGVILATIGESSKYSSWYLSSALTNPRFLKMIYWGIEDERVDRQVLVFCRNCHFIGVLGVISFFFIGGFE